VISVKCNFIIIIIFFFFGRQVDRINGMMPLDDLISEKPDYLDP
jgi:hypothetical protein